MTVITVGGHSMIGTSSLNYKLFYSRKRVICSAPKAIIESYHYPEVEDVKIVSQYSIVTTGHHHPSPTSELAKPVNL